MHPIADCNQSEDGAEKQQPWMEPILRSELRGMRQRGDKLDGDNRYANSRDE